jgi:iron complex outermembrane receptor protein
MMKSRHDKVFNRSKVTRFVSFALKGLTVTMFGLPFAQIAYADEENALAKKDEKEIEVISVSGIRGSLSRSLGIKRTSTGVVDGIASEDIADFPGFNITEELGRLPGVAISRTNGEGKQITVRGLAAEFTRVTINGQTVTSGNEGREVDFDVFASELFGEATITKTTTASMVEGGLAATVDLRTPRPFDLEEFVFRASAETAYAELSEKTTPRFSTMLSKQFDDGKYGVLVTLAKAKTYLRADVSQPWRYEDRGDSGYIYDFDNDGSIDTDFVNAVEARLPRNQLDIRDRDRLGVTGAFQYRPNNDLTFSFDYLYADQSEQRNRYTMDGNLQKNPEPRNREDFKVVDGQIVDGVWLDVNQRSEELLKWVDEKTTLANFEVDWFIAEDWNAFFKVSRSDSFKNVAEESYLIQGNGTFGYSLFSNNNFFTFDPAIDAQDPASFSLAQAKRKPINVNDEEDSLRFDLYREFRDSGALKKIKTGFYASEHVADVNRWEGSFSPRLLNGEVVAQGTSPDETAIPIGEFADTLPVDDLLSGFGTNVDSVTTSWVIADLDRIKDTAFYGGLLETGPGGEKLLSAPLQKTSAWEVTEDTYSGYVEANFEFEDLSVNAGVRAVRTEQQSNGFEPGENGAIAVSVDNNYTDVLPSLSLRYNASDELVVRAAASRNITRPTIINLAPGRTLDKNQLQGKAGNPELDPFRVNSFDISVEWYFSSEGLLAGNMFYKDMESFIITDSVATVIQGSDLIDDEGNSINGQTFNISQPVNGQGGTVKGFEATYQQPFTFLPGGWSGFGVIANYTYADSDVTTEDGTKTSLQGQSKSSYNIIGYYENDDFNVRLAYSWRDKFVKELRQGREVFWRAYGQLDVSARYNYSKNVAFTFEGINLTNENALQFDVFESRGIEYVNTGTTFRIGAQYVF